MMVNYLNKVLGLLIDTRRLDIGVPPAFVADTLRLLRPYHAGRKVFRVKDMESITGKLIFIAGTAPWLKLIMPQLFLSISAAVGENVTALARTNKSFRQMLKRQRDPSAPDQERTFAQASTARQAHNYQKTHFINSTMREELHLITRVLESKRGGRSLRAPLAHLVRRDPSATAWSDSCLYAAGKSSPPITSSIPLNLTTSQVATAST